MSFVNSNSLIASWALYSPYGPSTDQMESSILTGMYPLELPWPRFDATPFYRRPDPAHYGGPWPPGGGPPRPPEDQPPPEAPRPPPEPARPAWRTVQQRPRKKKAKEPPPPPPEPEPRPPVSSWAKWERECLCFTQILTVADLSFPS